MRSLVRPWRPRFSFFKHRKLCFCPNVGSYQKIGDEMAVTIEIPTAFRKFTDGTPKLDCNATTIAEALNILTDQFPGLSRHVRDDQGQIRQFLNVYLNEEDIRFLGGEDCAVKSGDKVLLVPSIAGGCA